MKFSLPFIAALAAISPAAAAPAAGEISMMAAGPQWTINDMLRQCDKPNKVCTYTFKVNTHVGTPTPCKFVVKAGAEVASHTNGGPAKCGIFTVTSGWSGQFGPGNGFTTLSVVDYAKKQIIWPAYTDKQLASGGKTVKPDQSYAPANLP